MRNILRTFGLLAILSVILSGFTGCTKAPDAQNAAVGEKPSANDSAQNSSANSAPATDKSSEYPPLPVKLAQSQIEMVDGIVGKVADRQGKVLLLNLWGIWCAPCRKEMPHLVEIQEQYKDRGFQIVGLNVGDEDGNPEDLDKIKNFGQEMKLNYELGRITEEMTGEFFKVSKQGAVPQSFLVDRQGHLRGVFIGGSTKVLNELRENVEKVVSE